MFKVNLFALSFTLFCSVFLYQSTTVKAQLPATYRDYVIQPKFINHDFVPKGDLSDSEWQGAEKVFLNNQYSPYDRDQAPVMTEVQVLYSKEYMYFGFRAHDPDPSKMRVHIAEHDKIDRDDQVGIILDTYNNNQFAYEFFLNPKGIQQDLIRAGDKKNMNFDMIWDSYTNIFDKGYTAIFKIPFKGMHFPKQEEQAWAVNFVRKYPREHHNEFSWTNLSFGNSCILCQSGTMKGVKGIESSNPIEIIPYAMGFQTASLKDPSDPSAGLKSDPLNGRIGGAVIYSPSSTSSLDLTINPDFSQVESDATEISINNTFALQYPEMRPFFLANQNLFQAGVASQGGFPGGNDLYYSRTINQPIAAAKYTQAKDSYSVAFLTAYDRDVPFYLPGLLESSTVQTDHNAYSNILRSKYNFGEQSFIGGLVTTRNLDEAHNYAGAVDWSFYLGNKYYFSGNAAYTDTKEIDDLNIFNSTREYGQSGYDAAFNGEKFGGAMYKVDFSRKAKIYSFGFNYEAIAPTFQAQHGFITRTDRRSFGGSQSFNYYPKPAWYSKGSISAFGTWRYDFANVFQERFIRADWSNSFSGQTNVTIGGFLVNDEWFRGVFFKNIYKGSINASTSPVNWLRLNGNYEAGRFIYRALNPEIGKGYNIKAGSTLIPTERLQLEFNYQFQTLSSLDETEKFYQGSISRLLGLYSFSSSFFFRLIGQYDSFSDEFQIYPLLYYKVNPFTKIYLGMTDNLRNFDQLGPMYDNHYYQTHREFFFKVQYLIQN